MKRLLLSVSLVCLLTSTAFANIIDFRDPVVFGLAADQASFTAVVEEFELTLAAGVFPVGDATLWWDHRDGFGVQYAYEQDEIEGPEYLRLSFSAPVILEQVHFSDLFKESGYLETGMYELNGSGTWETFTASPSQLIGSTNGELWLTIDETVNFITFSAPGLLQNGENHEYAVAGVKVAAVPLPSTLLIFGSGLLGLVGVRKKLRQ